MSVLFNSPYTKSPAVWSAQGAKITWVIRQPGTQLTNRQDPTSQTGSHNLYSLNRIIISAGRQNQTTYPLGWQQPIIMLGIPTGRIDITSMLGPTAYLQEFLNAVGTDCEGTVDVYLKPFSGDFKCNKPAGSSTTQTNKYMIIGARGCKLVQAQFDMQSSGQNPISIANGTFTLQFTNGIQYIQHIGADPNKS